MSEPRHDLELRGFLIRGLVQGVGFRWWTRDTAVGLGLAGHVRNLPDGSVEVHAWGPADVLGRFEERLHQGPPMARVTEVGVIGGDARASKDRFEIERWR